MSFPQVVHRVQERIVPCLSDQNSHHKPWEIAHCMRLDTIASESNITYSKVWRTSSVQVQTVNIWAFVDYTVSFIDSVLPVKFESKP